MYPFMPGAQPSQPAAQTDTDDPEPCASTEDERILRWHRDRLRQLGWPEKDAEHLARYDVDLHELADLIDGGCPRDLAWKIAS